MLAKFTLKMQINTINNSPYATSLFSLSKNNDIMEKNKGMRTFDGDRVKHFQAATVCHNLEQMAMSIDLQHSALKNQLSR